MKPILHAISGPLFAIAALGAMLMASVACAKSPMLDPATDKAGDPWCYLAKSTTVIGVPFQPDVTQITFDGAVFTRSAELCFFYGDKDRPLLARGKTFLEGWIPVVHYAWSEGDVAYDIEYFAAALHGQSADNTVNFVQVRMRNTGARAATGRFAAALRHTGEDCRFGGSAAAFNPNWRYAMTENSVLRDGKLTYTFSPGADREAAPRVAYQKPFLGREQFITARAECCLARYQRRLKVGESFVASFKMPRVPVADASYNRTLLAADYPAYRNDTVAWWKNLLHAGAVFEFPERCVQDAQRASLVHVLLATRRDGDRRIQTDGLPYPNFFLTSAPQMALAYLTSGHPEYARDVILPWAVRQQEGDGLYQDAALAHGQRIAAAHGHIMYIIARTAQFTDDRKLAARYFDSLAKAVAFIARSMQSDRYGLLPPAYPYDNEMISGHYTSNNTWALLGLRNAVQVARMSGHPAEAKAWAELAVQFESNILRGIAASAKADGYVPTGLYPYATGPTARRGFAYYTTDADWENMLLAYPSEVLAPGDPRVRGTVDHVRKDYAEGIMTYRHGLFLHQYITANQVEQYLAMGDTRAALTDFYHILVHGGSTYEGFENLVAPWGDRHVDPSCPSPHAWASAKLVGLIRDLVLLEYGGRGGQEPAQRELWLFHCLSPEWTKPGDKIAFRNAATEFGPLSATMLSSRSGATVTMHGTFHSPPAAYRVRIPYFKELVAFESNAKTKRLEGDCIVLSPDATTLSIRWKDKPGAHAGTFADLLAAYRKSNTFDGVDKEGRAIIGKHEPFLLDGEKLATPQPLSLALVRKAFQHEYARRAASAGKLVTVAAPALLTAEERRRAFTRQFGIVETNITTGCQVEASSNEPNYPPQNAVDGVRSLESSWRAGPYPQWLKLDLGKAVKLKGIHVWPYWGGGRYYRYCVDVSTDGQAWEKVGDKLANTVPATEAGDALAFTARDVRYIRINMTYHNLNSGVHIVEVKAVEAK